MSMLSSLVKNPLDGEQKPWRPRYGYLFLVVLVVSGGLYVYQRVHGGPAVPTSTDPATVYENAKAARERQEQSARSEAQDTNTEAALSDIAKAALALIEQTPIVLPDIERFSGDAVELAAWIEQIDVALIATVIEDPSSDEITSYLSREIPVLVSVIFIGEMSEHWVVLDESSRVTALDAMIGNRIVIVEAK